MKKFGRVLAILALWFLAGLTVLCIIGAFIGPERAKLMFNSTPAVILWLVLTAGLAASCVYFVMVRKKGWLAMLIAHIGVMLIVVGGMLGSDRVLFRQGLVADKDVYFSLGIGQTYKFNDMSVKLNAVDLQFYHRPATQAWKLYYETHLKDDKTLRQLVKLPADQGQSPLIDTPFALPGGIECTKLVRISDEMRDGPAIIMPTAAGEMIAIDVEPGGELMVAGKTARVSKIYDRFTLEKSPKGYRLAELSAGPFNPAVELSIGGKRVMLFSPGLTVKKNYRMPDGNMYMFLPSGLDRKGQAGPLTVIISMRKSDGEGGKTSTGISAAIEGQPEMKLTLQPLFADEKQWIQAGTPALVFVRQQDVKTASATLEITDDQGNVITAAIEKNSPLNFDGYHFYLNDISVAGNMAYIHARRDNGWLLVLTGLLAAALGICWGCWGNLRPAKKEQTDE